MDKLKILVVDDESRMRKLVKDFLTKKDFQVLEAEDGMQALDVFYKVKDIALVILDVMMPKMDGWQVCREIRSLSDVPIIMLTARSDERDELLGFELGVDEYISKPFSPKILVARVEAILRRSNALTADNVMVAGKIELLGFELGVDEYISKPFSPKILVARVEAILRRSNALTADNVMVAGKISLDKAAHEVKVDGKNIELSYKEFELLNYFMENQGIALSREKILNSVWNLDKAAHEVKVDGKNIELSYKEFELLNYFMENQGIALSREKILNSVWNYDYFGDARTIDTHVKKLRSKLGEQGDYIKTVWGMGYKFEVE